MPQGTPQEFEQLRLRLHHLMQMINYHAENGSSLYRLALSHPSGLDGESETTIVYVWAQTAADAIYAATHNGFGKQWATLESSPVLMRPTPEITSEWIAQFLAVPLP